jgi:hypothetical protein
VLLPFVTSALQLDNFNSMQHAKWAPSKANTAHTAQTAAMFLLLLLLPAGTRYASGAVLRVLRSYPGSWTAHVVSSDGASQVGCSALHFAWPSHMWCV